MKETEEKTEKKKKGSGIVIVILCIALLGGCFDKIAHDVTNGAYGDGEDIYEDASTGKRIYKAEDAEVKVTDLNKYVDFTEDKLIEELGVEKSVIGYYPDDENINFICIEGKIYTIMIRKEHRADSAYSILGISIGDKKDNLPTSIQEEFSLVNSDSIDGGMRDTYINNANGYSLAVDYDSDGSVIAVAYVLEPVEVPTISQTTDVQEEITEEVVEKYQIIPNYTYYSQSSDGIIMYANITENGDGTLDVEGFAYDYSNNLIEDLCFEAKFIYSEEDWYTSEDGIYDMVISYDSIEIMENWFTEENPDILFSGTFQLISED